jgi:phosphopantetheine adenylyltransferase
MIRYTRIKRVIEPGGKTRNVEADTMVRSEEIHAATDSVDDHPASRNGAFTIQMITMLQAATETKIVSTQTVQTLSNEKARKARKAVPQMTASTFIV